MNCLIMALKSRKFSVGLWATANFFGGYAHQKLIEGNPQIASHDIVNNILIPLFPSATMTLRNAIVDKEELSRYTHRDSFGKELYSVSGKNVYRQNLVFNGFGNFITSYVPYVAGRLVGKVI